MTLRTLEVPLNYKTIEDQVASFLYACGIVKDSENVRDIIFGDIDDKGVIKLTLQIEKEGGVTTG